MPKDAILESLFRLIELTKDGSLVWESETSPNNAIALSESERFKALLPGLKVVLTHDPTRAINMIASSSIHYGTVPEQFSDTLSVFDQDGRKKLDFPQMTLISGLYNLITNNRELAAQDFLATLQKIPVTAAR